MKKELSRNHGDYDQVTQASSILRIDKRVPTDNEHNQVNFATESPSQIIRGL